MILLGPVILPIPVLQVVHDDAVGGRCVVLEGHCQLGLEHAHEDGRVGAVQCHEWRQRLLGVGVEAPNLDQVVCEER